MFMGKVAPKGRWALWETGGSWHRLERDVVDRDANSDTMHSNVRRYI